MVKVTNSDLGLVDSDYFDGSIDLNDSNPK